MSDDTARSKLGQLLFELRGMGLNKYADRIYEAVWELKPRIHGIDCVKVPHSTSGMLHAEGDDSPYSVMDNQDLAESIRQQAIAELQREAFKQRVELEKERLRRPWWIRIFPWKLKLTIVRR